MKWSGMRKKTGDLFRYSGDGIQKPDKGRRKNISRAEALRRREKSVKPLLRCAHAGMRVIGILYFVRA